MPRFFCDYCDAYLTHDSAAGRQQHIRGDFSLILKIYLSTLTLLLSIIYRLEA